jgi:hypothetical protein
MGMKEKLRKIWSISADKIKKHLWIYFLKIKSTQTWTQLIIVTDDCGTFFFSLFKVERQQKPTFLTLKRKNWEIVYKFLRSKVIFNFKISSSLLGHYFSTLVLWFSSMCVQIVDLIRQPWGLGILLRTEFRANNGVKFFIKKDISTD